MHTRSLLLAAVTTVVGWSSVASGATIFLVTDGTGTFALTENQPSFTTDPVDGVTLTADVTGATNFNATGGGVAVFGGTNSQIDAGEDFTLAFSEAVTLDAVQITLVSNGSSDTIDLTFTAATGGSVTASLSVPGGSGTVNDLAVPVGLTVDANEAITVSRSAGGPGFALETVTVTVPEPGSMALLGLGAGLMLVRRRSA